MNQVSRASRVFEVPPRSTGGRDVAAASAFGIELSALDDAAHAPRSPLRAGSEPNSRHRSCRLRARSSVLDAPCDCPSAVAVWADDHNRPDHNQAQRQSSSSVLNVSRSSTTQPQRRQVVDPTTPGTRRACATTSSSVRKETGVRGVGEGDPVTPTRELVADLDIGVGRIASSDAGASQLLDVEAEPLSQFGR
jgi:hypothetical protein